MAVNIVVENQAVPGAFNRKNVLVTLDASYPNPAGYVFTPASFGLKTLKALPTPVATTLAAGAYETVLIPTYASDTSGNVLSFALHLIISTTGAQVANAVNVSGASFAMTVEGN